MSGTGAALIGVILAVITLALLLPVRRPRPSDTLDAMVGSAAMDAYLRQELSAAAYTDLPGPDGRRTAGSSGLQTPATTRNPQYRAEESPIQKYARIFRMDLQARRFKAEVDAFCADRDAARHEAKMNGIATRNAEPMPPHLWRSWQDDTGGFARFVDDAQMPEPAAQRTWSLGAGSFIGATS